MSGLIGLAGQKSNIINDNGGVSHLTTFQMTANKTTDGTITAWSNPVSSVDGSGRIGKPVTMSGGVFTLPSMGTWLILGTFSGQKVASDSWLSVHLIREADGLVQDEGVFGGGNSGASGDVQAGEMGIVFTVAYYTPGTSQYRFTAGSVSTGSYISGHNWWTTGASPSHVTFIKMSKTNYIGP